MFFKQKIVKAALEENYKDQSRKNWKKCENQGKEHETMMKYAEVGDTVELDENIHMQEADQCSTYFLFTFYLASSL